LVYGHRCSPSRWAASRRRPGAGRKICPGGRSRSSRSIGHYRAAIEGADRRATKKSRAADAFRGVEKDDPPASRSSRSIAKEGLTKSTSERILSRNTKATVEKMVKSLKLVQADPIALGANTKCGGLMNPTL